MENKSLYRIISENIDETGELPAKFSLPKQEKNAMFADGAMDGISIYHMGHSPLSETDKSKIADILMLVSDGNFEKAENEFDEFCQEHRTVGIIDDIQGCVMENRNKLNAENIYRFSESMMKESKSAECVKVGMSILELFNLSGDDEMMEAVRNIGKSDEFTIFSVFIMRKWTNANMEILDLAKHVHGWGRIHCVDFIEPDNEEIKKWILENGVDNHVVSAYSAIPAFEKSGMTDILKKDKLTHEEISGIIKIANALLDEGPVSGISNIDNAEEMLVSIIRKASEMIPLDICDYNRLNSLNEWLKETDNNKSEEYMNVIISDERVHDQVKKALANGEAVELAKILEIPYREDVFNCIKNHFEDKFYLVSELINDEKYTDSVLNLFEEKLPLDQIATGSADELGLGEKYKYHRINDFLVRNLGNLPGKGKKFIIAALQSPAVNNRNGALAVLNSWMESKTLAEICPEAFDLIMNIKEMEVNPDVKKKMEEIVDCNIKPLS